MSLLLFPYRQPLAVCPSSLHLILLEILLLSGHPPQTIYLCEYIGHPRLHPWRLLISTIIKVVHAEQRDLELS